jgi:hypothetical protein
VRYYGRWMRDEAEKRIGHHYPKAQLPDGSEATVIAWLWARTVHSPDPRAKGAMVPLVSSFLLSTKEGKKVWAEPVIDASAPEGWHFKVHTGILSKANEERLKKGTKTGRGANFACVLTGSSIVGDYKQTPGWFSLHGLYREAVPISTLILTLSVHMQDGIQGYVGVEPQLDILAPRIHLRPGVGEMQRPIGQHHRVPDLVRRCPDPIRKHGLKVLCGVGISLPEEAHFGTKVAEVRVRFPRGSGVTIIAGKIACRLKVYGHNTKAWPVVSASVERNPKVYGEVKGMEKGVHMRS